MSLIQQVAEWVHARSGGAISPEVAIEFSLTVSEASIVMGQIHRESRFTTRVEHFCLVGDNGRGRHTRPPLCGCSEAAAVAQDPSHWHLRGSGGPVR